MKPPMSIETLNLILIIRMSYWEYLTDEEKREVIAADLASNPNAMPEVMGTPRMHRERLETIMLNAKQRSSDDDAGAQVLYYVGWAVLLGLIIFSAVRWVAA